MEENQTQPNNDPQQSADDVVTNKTDVLGIISLVCAFIGLQVVGFILGLIGVNKAKKENYSGTLSKIGWILNLVIMVIGLIIIILVLVAVPSLQRNQRDTATRNELSIIDSELTYYRSNNSGYLPRSLSQLDLENTISGTTVQLSEIDYKLLPQGCTDNCTDYLLSVELESGEIYEISSN